MKYTNTRHPKQYRHTRSLKKNVLARHTDMEASFEKTVLYRGEDVEENAITYRNAESYLKKLKC